MTNVLHFRSAEHDPRHLLGSEEESISFSAVLSALSFAFDLTEGALPGHALRTCILGMRIGRAVNLAAADLAALYHALLLKDIGCSSNAVRMDLIVQGDHSAQSSDPLHASESESSTRPAERRSLKLMWSQVLPRSASSRAASRAASREEASAPRPIPLARLHEEMIALRCERGANIALKLGLTAGTAEAIQALDEHWDGSGLPLHFQGESIPLLARILAIAQHLDVFASRLTPHFALKVLRERSGKFFDPELVRVVFQLQRESRLWTNCLRSDSAELARMEVLALEPKRANRVSSDQIDRICEAFAEIVDAKSPFTYRHSVAVAEIATAMAVALNLAPDRRRLVRRAALLHDLGKLAVSNAILDKSTDLTTDEWDLVLQHPRLTREILSRIQPFAELAAIAGAHHEKLDGTGYPDQLIGPELGIEARIIAVADTYQALTERRPYRAGVSHEAAMVILCRLTPQKLDPHCVAAVDMVRTPRPRLENWALESLPERFARRKRPVPEAVFRSRLAVSLHG